MEATTHHHKEKATMSMTDAEFKAMQETARKKSGYYWDDATNSRTPHGNVATSDWLNRGNKNVKIEWRVVRFSLNWGDATDPMRGSHAEVKIDLLNDFAYEIAPQFFCGMTPAQLDAYFEILTDLRKWAEREIAYMRTVAPNTES